MSDWSSTPPAKPGFYWLRTEGDIRVAHVVHGILGLHVKLPGLIGDDAALQTLAMSPPAAVWCGPVETPQAWTLREPTEPGWYWVKGPKRIATVVRLFARSDDSSMWVSMPGQADVSLRRAGHSECVWAGPLEA